MEPTVWVAIFVVSAFYLFISWGEHMEKKPKDWAGFFGVFLYVLGVIFFWVSLAQFFLS